MDSNKLLNFLKEIPGGVTLFDKDLKIVDISDFVINQTGRKKEDFVGNSFLSAVHESDMKRVTELVDSFVNSDQEQVQINFRGLSKNSKSHYARVNLKKIEDASSIKDGICYISLGMPIGDLHAETLSLISESLKYQKLEKI